MKLWLLWFSVVVCCFLRFRFDSGLRPGGLTFLALQWPYRSVLHTSEKVCCHGFSGSGKRWWAECVSIIFYSIGFRYHFTRSGAVLLDRRTVAASSVKHRCVIFFIELNAPLRTRLVSTTQAGPFEWRLLMRRCLQPWKVPLGAEPPSPLWSDQVLSSLKNNTGCKLLVTESVHPFHD